VFGCRPPVVIPRLKRAVIATGLNSITASNFDIKMQFCS
jgi:hypothetical protein